MFHLNLEPVLTKVSSPANLSINLQARNSSDIPSIHATSEPATGNKCLLIGSTRSSAKTSTTTKQPPSTPPPPQPSARAARPSGHSDAPISLSSISANRIRRSTAAPTTSSKDRDSKSKGESVTTWIGVDRFSTQQNSNPKVRCY